MTSLAGPGAIVRMKKRVVKVGGGCAMRVSGVQPGITSVMSTGNGGKWRLTARKTACEVGVEIVEIGGPPEDPGGGHA